MSKGAQLQVEFKEQLLDKYSERGWVKYPREEYLDEVLEWIGDPEAVVVRGLGSGEWDTKIIICKPFMLPQFEQDLVRRIAYLEDQLYHSKAGLEALREQMGLTTCEAA